MLLFAFFLASALTPAQVQEAIDYGKAASRIRGRSETGALNHPIKLFSHCLNMEFRPNSDLAGSTAACSASVGPRR